MIKKLKKNIYEEKIKVISSTAWDVYPHVVKLISDDEKRILDAGCGDGKLMRFMPLGKEVHGIDILPKAVKRARKKGYRKVSKANLEKIPYPANYFDLVICIQVLQYVKDPVKIMRELKRVAKNRIIISVPNHHWLKLKAKIFKKFAKVYENIVNKEQITDTQFVEELAKRTKLKIIETNYASPKLNLLRNIFPKYLSSELIVVLEK